MKNTLVFTKERIVVFFLSLVMPVLAMAYGVFGLIFRVCINRSFFLTFILLPLVTVILLALCIFSGIRRRTKAVLSVLLLLFFVVAFLNGVLFGVFARMHHYQNEKVASHYAAVTEENELMPSVDDVGQPTKMEYYDVFTKYFCFFAGADYLICRYDAEEYALKKKQLEENYIFQTETMDSYGYLCEPSEEVDGYYFRVLSTKGEYEPFVDYPWYMTLIGYSDEKQEIIYLSYGNTDIDYHTSLSEFLYEECAWKQVR
jgi:hypothetical protein